MKIIKTSTYKKLVECYSKPYSNITYKEDCIRLEKELEEAKNLKSILEKMSGLTINGVDWCLSNGGWVTTNFPDTVLQYTEDILGGKVIKQEGNKCLVVDKDGNVKTGLTKQKADKGYSYKLVRE